MKTIKAWYFAPKGERLRYNDDRPIEVGVTHSVEGKPKTCINGLHAMTFDNGRRVFDIQRRDLWVDRYPEDRDELEAR